MAQQKHTKKKAVQTAEPLSAQWFYDELMQHIEPDLLSKNIQTLDEKYKGETAEEKKIRMEHYAIAFLIFDRAVKELDSKMRGDTELWKKQMTHFMHMELGPEEDSTLQNIEDSISGSSDHK